MTRGRPTESVTVAEAVRAYAAGEDIRTVCQRYGVKRATLYYALDRAGVATHTTTRPRTRARAKAPVAPPKRPIGRSSHVVDHVRFRRGVPSRQAPVTCACGETVPVAEFQAHRLSNGERVQSIVSTIGHRVRGELASL